jgi:tetratricopeptide (TPR) repeat protein
MRKSCIKKIIFISLLFNLFITEDWGGSCFAQNKNIDSLLILLRTDKQDTNKVIHYYILCRGYVQIGDYDIAMYYANSALILAQQLNFKKGIATCYNITGIIYMNQGNYSDALALYSKALEISEELKDQNQISKCLGNIALVYSNQGNYPEALNYFFKGLKIEKETGNKVATGETFGNIGGVYYKQANYSEALSYFFDGLKIGEELGDKDGIRTCLSNIGLVYCNQGDYSKALNYNFRELKMAEEAGDKDGITTVLGNIGIVYVKQKDYSRALDNYFKALKIDGELKNKIGITQDLSNIGSLYTATGKYKKAEDYFKRAISIDSSIGILDELRRDEEAISHLYDNMGKYKEALLHYKKAIVLKDTLFTIEKDKEITRHEMNFKFQQQEEIKKKEQDKKDALAKAEKNKQQFIIILVSSILVLVFIFAGVIFKSLRTTRKQKQIIEIKNIETEHQKKIIEEKNKDITDSIHYAKQIQSALLREEAHVSKHLPEHFILFLPKDIVSGDFYWGFEKHDYWYVAAADCTGHGVPGAIMSMLGISFLNDIVSSDALFSPAEILNQLRDRVISELRQTGEDGSSKDGMDISLIRLNLKTFELQWAGANNALNYIQAGELKEIKADKQPIGYHPQQKPFTNHEIQLQKGDSIYIYSDGYADQFGGPKGKKLTYKKLDNFINENYQLSLENQKTLFREYFDNWKGSLEQLDDVCVIGIKI